jgi:uncharacterized YccA/Bax inhibitor family protein
MSNIAFNENSFKNLESDGSTMTVEWSIQKSAFLILLTIASAIATWMIPEINTFVTPLYIPFIIWTFILALVIIFAKKTAPFLSPVYAILEWVILAAISMIYEAMLPGIVMQSVGLTFAIFLTMLWLYASRIIVVTQKFRMWVVAATGAIALVYVISLVWSLTGWYNVPYIHESGIIGIWISVFIVGIAAFNLALDFDNIEMWANANAPKYMEWYSAFGLLVTLIWLYLEVLRLLAKIRSND